MDRPLDQMSEEELWKLFPIILQEYDEAWVTRYLQEAIRIKESVGVFCVDRISHIGSTSVDGLLAKPTIDILLEITSDTDLKKLIGSLELLGYRYLEQPSNPPPHMMFLKGYTIKGFRGQPFHLHVRYADDWDELYFRDYLRDHAEIARAYARLKSDLKTQYEYNRDGYTRAKTAFIRKYTLLARHDYRGRYEPDSTIRNPWQMIELDVYEAHMSFASVAQMQMLDAIMKGQFERNSYPNVMVLGVAGGNGLRHVPDKISKIYGVDVNASYLAMCVKRFAYLGNRLVVIQQNLQEDGNKLPTCQCVFANLVLEYIGIDSFLRVVGSVGAKYLSIVIQFDADKPGYLSDSPYLAHLCCLDQIHQSISETKLTQKMSAAGFELCYREGNMLPNQKQLICLEYQLTR